MLPVSAEVTLVLSLCFDRLLTSVLWGDAAPHPEQVLCTGQQGSVVVFSSHCFHGGTLNSSGSTRMAMHSAFVRRQVRYHEGHSYEQGDAISPAVFQRLTRTRRGRAVVALLDVSWPKLHGAKM